MKQISYILMTAGGLIVTIGAMCEADGQAYELLIAGIAAGLVLVMIGRWLYKLADRREQERRRDFWINKKIAP